MTALYLTRSNMCTVFISIELNNSKFSNKYSVSMTHLSFQVLVSTESGGDTRSRGSTPA